MTDKPICGFGLKDRGLCHTISGEGFCADHGGRVCVGCGRRALRECGSGTCPAVLCDACTHVGLNRHARPTTQRAVVEQEMTTAIRMILDDLAEEEVLPSTAPQREAAAPRLLHGLTLHTTLKMLAALGQEQR
jgi:hypothetical protein